MDRRNATAAVIGALFLLYMLYSGMVHGVRVGSMRRRVSTREAAINEMRAENQRLSEENALPKMVLYNVNPAENYVFATMAGNFQDGSVAGKVQFGDQVITNGETVKTKRASTMTDEQRKAVGIRLRTLEAADSVAHEETSPMSALFTDQMPAVRPLHPVDVGTMKAACRPYPFIFRGDVDASICTS